MPEFIFTGTVRLANVFFFIEAKNEGEAVEKAKAGEYKSYDLNTAEAYDFDIDPSTVKAND